MPDRAIACGADGDDRKILVRRLQLLQARDVGRLAFQPFEQTRQPGADAVDVIGRDLHRGSLASSKNLEAPPMTIEALRTPEERFAHLPDFAYPPQYVDDLPGYEGLRAAYVDTGPRNAQHAMPVPARRAFVELPVPTHDPGVRRARLPRRRARLLWLRPLRQAGERRGLQFSLSSQFRAAAGRAAEPRAHHARRAGLGRAHRIDVADRRRVPSAARTTDRDEHRARGGHCADCRDSSRGARTAPRIPISQSAS